MDNPSDFTILVFSAFATSTLSGVIGVGGGVLLIGVMGLYFPLMTLVPLHGIVQIGSNGFRSALHFSHIDRKLVLKYGLGCLIGASIGAFLVFPVPDHIYKICLGTFILLVTFAPKAKNPKPFIGKWYIIGSVVGLINLFAGATGLLAAPFFLSERLQKYGILATKAACETLSHTTKVVVYFVLGFTAAQYLWLIGGMVAAVALGTWFGKKILRRVPEIWFRRAYVVLVFGLSTRLIILGIRDLSL